MSPQSIELRRAINHAQRLTGRPNHGANQPPAYLYRPGVVCTEYGYAVTMAERFAPFAASRHRRASYAHLVRAVFIGWRRGAVAGLKVVCWCNSQLTDPDLFAELPEFARQCRMCEFRVTGEIRERDVRPMTVRVTVEAVATC